MRLIRPILAGLVFAIAVLSVPTAWAQVGSLEVTVFEKTATGRETIPGASVELSDPQKKFPTQSQQTDLDGKAVFSNIPAGRGYVLTVIATGYNAAPVANVQVVAGKSTPMAVAILPTQKEEVNVIAKRPVVEVANIETTTNIGAEFFNDLPVYGRDYQNALVLAPGVNDADGDGNVTVHGSRERDFKVTVDGVSNVDPLTGQRLSQVNPDAIEEIQIVDTGADLSMGGAVGGYARLTIKSGGNTFEGSSSLYVVDEAFHNDGAGDTDPQPYKRRKPSGYVSGPLVKDRLWYLASVEMTKETQPVNVLGGADATIESNGRTELGKITWQANSKNRLALQYSADPLKIEPFGVDTLTPAESSLDFERGGPTYSLKWTATLSPTSLWESTVAFSDVEYKYGPHDRSAKNRCASGVLEGISIDPLSCIDTQSGFTSGVFSQDYADTRQRRSYGLDATKFINEWLGGSHDVKYGMLVERVNYDRDRESRPQLFKAGLPQSFIFPSGGDPGGGINFGTVPASRLLLTRYFPERLKNGANGNNLALYFQDTYQPASNLSFSLALRLNREELSADGFTPFNPQKERVQFEKVVVDCVEAGNSPAVCVAINSSIFTASPYDNPNNFPACSVALNPRQCAYLQFAQEGGRTLKFRNPEPFTIINNNLSRAIGATWDPWSNGRTQLATTWVRQYGDAFLQIFLNEQGPDALTTSYSLNDQDEVLNTAVTTGTAFQISQVDRNLNSAYSETLTVGFQREIASETSVRLRYVNRSYEDQYQDVDTNHVPVFYDNLTPGQLARFPRCRRIGKFADCTGSTVVVTRVGGGPGGGSSRFIDSPDGIPDLQLASPLFNNIYTIGNFNSSTYEAYIFELERRFYQNWEGNISYTWSRSLGQAEDYAQSLGDDATNTDDERGPLSTDQRHVVKMNGRVLINKWGGFRLGANVTYETGLPYSITTTREVVDFPTDLSGSVGAGRDEQFVTQRVTYPTGQRNDRRDPSFWNFDINFQKEFKIKDAKATFQVSAFNLLNENAIRILRVERVRQYNGEIVSYRDIPSSYRPFGRFFEVAFKLNF